MQIRQSSKTKAAPVCTSLADGPNRATSSSSSSGSCVSSDADVSLYDEDTCADVYFPPIELGSTCTGGAELAGAQEGSMQVENEGVEGLVAGSGVARSELGDDVETGFGEGLVGVVGSHSRYQLSVVHQNSGESSALVHPNTGSLTPIPEED